MSLIQAKELAKAYGAQEVFADITVSIPHGARIALVGSNGIGKSTLLRVLAGFESADSGSHHQAKNMTIGYLPQELQSTAGWQQYLELALETFCLTAFEDLQRMEVQLSALEKAMADPRKAEEAMAGYGQLQEKFELAGGYSYHAETHRVLRGLGFEQPQFDQTLSKLSGGERTRANLARLLLEDPDLLVLDEPTNHLDIEAVTWLEGWLSEWSGAALIVSHDRYFLDQTIDNVWELSARGLESYRGNYSAFRQQREERLARQAKVYQSQREHIKKERDFIQRNIAGQNTRQAQGRRTRLERFMEDEALAVPTKERQVAIQFEAKADAGQIALETRNLSIGHKEPLFKVPDLKLRRGQCAALIGPNGAGKSTFLKTLVGRLDPLQGEVEWGANVSIGYFAQAHEGLNPERTVLESLITADPELKISEARDVLGQYLFKGDEVHKKIEALSGGERGRLALAKLAQQGANFLLLDEPTNHLDLTAQEVLQRALESFPGTILLASHDRYLIEQLASQVWFVHPDHDELRRIRGAYHDYLEWRRGWEQAQQAAQPKEKPAKPRQKQGNRKAMERRLNQIEVEVEALEKKLSSLAARIEQGGQDHQKLRSLGSRYEELEVELQEHLSEWERLSEELEGA